MCFTTVFVQLTAAIRFLVLIVAYAAVRIQNPSAVAVNLWLFLHLW